MLFYGKIGPRNTVQDDYIVRFCHSKLLVKAKCVFVKAGIHDDLVFTACELVQPFDQRCPDAFASMFPDDTQIGDEQPVGEVRDAETDADDPTVPVPGDETDGRPLHQCGDPFAEPLLWVLSPQIRMLQKFDVFFGGEPFLLYHVSHLCMLLSERRKNSRPPKGDLLKNWKVRYQRLENWGARRAAFRPYFWKAKSEKALVLRAFSDRLFQLAHRLAPQ